MALYTKPRYIIHISLSPTLSTNSIVQFLNDFSIIGLLLFQATLLCQNMFVKLNYIIMILIKQQINAWNISLYFTRVIMIGMNLLFSYFVYKNCYV